MQNRNKQELKQAAKAMLEAIENGLIVVGPNHGEHINTDSFQFYVDELRRIHEEVFADSEDTVLTEAA